MIWKVASNLKQKKVKCKWCENEYKETEIHKCPSLFIHKIKELSDSKEEHIIRGKHLIIEWLGEGILIREIKSKLVVEVKEKEESE